MIFMRPDCMTPVYFQQAFSSLQFAVNTNEQSFPSGDSRLGSSEPRLGTLHIWRKGECLRVRWGCILLCGKTNYVLFVCFHHVFKLPYLQLQDSAK